MVDRRELKFDLGVWNDELRSDAQDLAAFLQTVIPNSRVYYESLKTDLGHLVIEIDNSNG